MTTEKPRKKKKTTVTKKYREGPLPETVKLSKENKDFYDERKWPDNLIYYTLKGDPEKCKSLLKSTLFYKI